MGPRETLELFPFFRETSEDRQREMLGAVRAASYPAGALAFATGASCAGVVFVGSGRVRVVKQDESGREISLYHVSSGETCLLTLSCALTGDPYAADGLIDETVEGVVLPVAAFGTWFDTYPGFRDYVIRTMTGRVVELMQLVEDVAFRNTGSRLAGFLLEAGRARESSVVETTHDEIATELGASRETVSRLLKDLERRGLVQLSRGAVQLLDPRALEDRVG